MITLIIVLAVLSFIAIEIMRTVRKHRPDLYRDGVFYSLLVFLTLLVTGLVLFPYTLVKMLYVKIRQAKGHGK